VKTTIAIALLALMAAVPATSGTASTTLVGKVGPGFTISLTMAGKKVSKLKAGTYAIQVHDNAVIHNFHLTGPGVNKSTSVNQTATKTWILKLKAGKYHYQCDPHASFMSGNFTVT